MPRLPEKQQRILDFIKSQHCDTGVFPSVREIAAHMDFKSTNTVDYHLRRMEANGVIERGGRRARSFTGLGDKNASMTARSRSGFGTNTAARASQGIPLIGRVAAGQPILAEQHYEDMLNFSTLFKNDESTFALKVQGDSMMDVGIMDGDMVIVKHQSNISNGEIGVAMVDGEATVKRIFDEGDTWRLEPENTSMRPILVRKGNGDFSLAGKVIGVVRRM